MNISICDTVGDNASKGIIISFSNSSGKKQINESDFFPDGSDIETKVQQLKKMLRQYFDANP